MEYLYRDFSGDVEIIQKEGEFPTCPHCGQNMMHKECGVYWWGNVSYDEGRESYDHTGTAYQCIECGKYFIVED